MGMEYWTKLYQRILQSSVWKLPSDHRIVWITLLALKDEHGCIFGTAEWLADQALVNDDVCQKALKVFLAPDKRSRTPDNQGKKIEAIDGGWRVLNHHLYRDGMEDQREKWRRQKAAQRAKEAEILEKLKGHAVTTTKDLAEELSKLQEEGESDGLNESLTPEQRQAKVVARVKRAMEIEEEMRKKRDRESGNENAT